MANPHRADPETDAEAEFARKTSGVRRASQEEEIQRLYRQLSDGSLDLSPPSVPPMMGSRDEEDEPITEQFELPASESMPAAARDRGVLVRVDGPANGQVFSLETAELLIGRGSAADLRLADEGVSRRHALLLHTRGHYFIQDMESSNWTFL